MFALQKKNGFFILLYCNAALYIFCESGFLTKYSEVSTVVREKTSEMLHWGVGNCLHFHKCEGP